MDPFFLKFKILIFLEKKTVVVFLYSDIKR